MFDYAHMVSLSSVKARYLKVVGQKCFFFMQGALD